jgi:hypothetical protein
MLPAKAGPNTRKADSAKRKMKTAFPVPKREISLPSATNLRVVGCGSKPAAKPKRKAASVVHMIHPRKHAAIDFGFELGEAPSERRTRRARNLATTKIARLNVSEIEKGLSRVSPSRRYK